MWYDILLFYHNGICRNQPTDWVITFKIIGIDTYLIQGRLYKKAYSIFKEWEKLLWQRGPHLNLRLYVPQSL